LAFASRSWDCFWMNKSYALVQFKISLWCNWNYYDWTNCCILSAYSYNRTFLLSIIHTIFLKFTASINFATKARSFTPNLCIFVLNTLFILLVFNFICVKLDIQAKDSASILYYYRNLDNTGILMFVHSDLLFLNIWSILPDYSQIYFSIPSRITYIFFQFTWDSSHSYMPKYDRKYRMTYSFLLKARPKNASRTIHAFIIYLFLNFNWGIDYLCWNCNCV